MMGLVGISKKQNPRSSLQKFFPEYAGAAEFFRGKRGVFRLRRTKQGGEAGIRTLESGNPD